MSTIAFDEVGRIPTPRDNVAIAVCRVQAGTGIHYGQLSFTLPHTMMEGHRFAVRPIGNGEPLLSWGLPFGHAIRDIEPGEYVCNQSILDVLAKRDIDFELPHACNFADHMQAASLDEAHFQAGEQVARRDTPLRFEGFPRDGTRGVGTRNFIIILATTSRSVAFAEALAKRFEGVSERFVNIDGVVAVTHTEGGATVKPNNLDFVLRTLAGFIVHPNVGAVLSVDYGAGAFGNADLERFLRQGDYALDDVLHAFVDIDSDRHSELARTSAIIESWLPEVNACERSAQPLSHLKVALQCGGSDAFSGISGNALAGWVAKEIIRNGGGANLAETDELIGAESYMLDNVRDLQTAQRFLDKIAIFKERARWHGSSAEGNGSGGNKYRGLYNIALKSIGAARKRDPDVCLDYVIDYAAPMHEPGYYFMDSPGNDLESIAGQVASGCNIIFFITGNGSITNFPFVPTLKLVTTTGRFQMLANEMDVNAGRYNDGESMDSLGSDTFELAQRIASGERSKGELAGHAQVQIWRDWPQTNAVNLALLQRAPAPKGDPLGVQGAPPVAFEFAALQGADGLTADQIALVMPTSLCSGQVARLLAEDLNKHRPANSPVSRFVALVHTEGCGSANSDELYLQTLVGHLAHRFTAHALMLEHGCERTHNDAVRHYLARVGRGIDDLGFASVQLDGGMQAVHDKVQNWFGEAMTGKSWPQTSVAGLSELRIALLASGELPDPMARAFAALAGGVVGGGGTVVIAENGALARSAVFREALLQAPTSVHATLAYGQYALTPGLHVMQSPTQVPVEVATGLGGTGVEIMLIHVGDAPVESHPMIAMLQFSLDEHARERYAGDLDLELNTQMSTQLLRDRLLERVSDVLSRRYTPRLSGNGMSNFQLTRGLLGISL